MLKFVAVSLAGAVGAVMRIDGDTVIVYDPVRCAGLPPWVVEDMFNRLAGSSRPPSPCAKVIDLEDIRAKMSA